MPTVIRLPAFSATMETAKVVSWLVEVGDTVEKGQVLAEIETDKALAELESPVAGIVQTIVVPASDEEIDVESALVEIDDGSSSESQSIAPETEKAAEAPRVSPTSNAAPEGRSNVGTIKAAPAARNAAREAGISLADIVGTGPNGRITKNDVLEHVKARESGSSREGDASLRQAVARAMVASKSTVPHFYTETDIVVDGLLGKKRELSDGGVKTTVTAHLISAVAKALNDVEEIKYRWEDGQPRHKAECDIAVAVDVGEGVVAPVIRGADRMDVVEISQRLTEITDAARSKSLKQSELGDASLTISNLGMFAIDRFYPIVNLPEPMIIGIGRIRTFPVFDGDSIAKRHIVTVTQAVDHRVIDGALAGRFASALQKIIEGIE